MGTRSLTIVKYKSKKCIAQYGQHDGYPGYSLQFILDFLADKSKLSKLKDRLDNRYVELIKRDRVDREKMEGKYLNSTLGCDILDVVISDYVDGLHKGRLRLEDNERFGEDSLFCEWAYVINLDQMMVHVYKGFNFSPISKGEHFYKYNRYCTNSEYKPVKLVLSLLLDNDEFKSRPKEFIKKAINDVCVAATFAKAGIFS
jgi:hypothetical protein